MRRVRGPTPNGTFGPLYRTQSLETLTERFHDYYDESRNQPIDLAEADYGGCVYVLNCKNRLPEQAEKVSLYQHDKTQVPWWVAPARKAPARLYVGRAKDLIQRIWQHIQGADYGGAHFTDIFYPTRLERVFLYNHYDEFRNDIEGRVAQTIDNENPDAFVYSDRYDTLRGYKDYGDVSEFTLRF